MQTKLRRKIQAAMFEGTIGPVAASELLAMPEDRWGLLRDRLTDGRNCKENGLIAKCMMCGSNVFIEAKKAGGKPHPLFAHFRGGDPSCPWHHRSTRHPNQIRADQYHGQQESLAHRMLCCTIDELVKADSRYIRSSVGKYVRPTENMFGRYPDVCVEWRGFVPLAIEIQLSNTFQTEISARCLHYNRECFTLIWVLYGIDPRNKWSRQSYRDVVRRHRGNAFTLDKDAVDASHQQATLVLKCFLKNADDSFDPPILVRLDELKFPTHGLPYFEDRLFGLERQRIDSRRKRWFEALAICPDGLDRFSLAEPIVSALDDLRQHIAPVLSLLDTTKQQQDFEIARLVAIVFSIVATANGEDINYASRDPNIKAMLNTKLHVNSGIQRYALLIEKLLQSTRLDYLLEGSVGTKLEQAKVSANANLCREQELEWQIMAHLIPEVFDPVIREEMTNYNELPRWAVPKIGPAKI